MRLTHEEQRQVKQLRDREAEAQRQSQQRLMQFLVPISERTGIPLPVLGVDVRSGAIIDARQEPLPDCFDPLAIDAYVLDGDGDE